MIVKLNEIQISYLNDKFSKCKKDFAFKSFRGKDSKLKLIKINENIADEIRDWASEELQTKGFDINYKLTPEGEILQDIIDAFYIE